MSGVGRSVKRAPAGGGPNAGERSRRRLFLESAAFDSALVLVVSASLAVAVSYGFPSTDGLRGNLALLCAMQVPLIAAMFAGTWSKRAIAPSIGATAAIAALIVGAAIATSTQPVFDGVEYNDVPGNNATFALAAVACAVAAFLLSRRRFGLVVLLVSGIVACGAVQFLWREWLSEQSGLVASGAFLMGTAMLFIYQTYKQSVYSAKRAKRTSFLGALAFSALVSAACMLVGVALFYGVVDGLGLTTPEIKPFERVVARPVDENAGTYTTYDFAGDETNDEVQDSDEDSRNDAGGTSSDGDAGEDSRGGVGESVSQVFKAFDARNWSDGDDPHSYQFIRLGVYLAILLLVLLITAVILAWRRRREWRLLRMEKRGDSYSSRVWQLYGFLLERFKRLGISKPEHLTPLEFAASYAVPLEPFSRDSGGVDFMEVTGAYLDACWGGAEIDERQYERVVGFYRAFFANARRYVGWRRWLFFKFWRI